MNSEVAIKQEMPDESTMEIKIEEHGVHFPVKREVQSLDFDCTTTTPIKSEIHGDPKQEKEYETESDGEVQDESSDDESVECKEARLKCDETSSHNDEKLLDCPHCDYKVKQKAHLLFHLRRCHLEKLPHICNRCSYRSFDLSSLEKHREKHEREPMKCEFCSDFVTKDLIQMRNHKQRVHVQKCPDCCYKSLSTENLRRHMLIHETETTLTCPHCNYRTVLQKNFNRHVARKHMVENADYKKHKCPDCSFKTNHSKSYQYHLYSHTGEQPFSCDHCDYKAAQSNQLKLHILRKHSDEKPFKCEFCQRGYVQQAALRAHLAVHSKEGKPFRCGKCDFSSVYKSSFRIHKKFKRCRMFACAVCTYKARSAGGLRRHVRDHFSCRPSALKAP